MESQVDHYEFRIEGHLGTSWATWFDGLTIRHTDTGDTLISGPIEDQAALHGVLMKIRDLGLPLVAVTRAGSADGTHSAEVQVTTEEENYDESR